MLSWRAKALLQRLYRRSGLVGAIHRPIFSEAQSRCSLFEVHM